MGRHLILLNEFLAINGAVLETSDDLVVEMILRAAQSDRAFRDQAILELTKWLTEAIVDMNEEEEA